jgi:4'-phosphopantetheinyl transferase EntD
VIDPEPLRRFLDEELPRSCIGAVRAIVPGDEELLTPLEARGLDRAVISVRRASGAGRDLARLLCKELGLPIAEIPRSPQRYPEWPVGLTGSITHDAQFAAAIAGPANNFGGIGVDIEPPKPLPAGVIEIVASTDELAAFSELPYGDKALFSIKEAVFKAVYPHDQVFLDFCDVTVVRSPQIATTKYGRIVNWRVLTFPWILAIAWWK